MGGVSLRLACGVCQLDSAAKRARSPRQVRQTLVFSAFLAAGGLGASWIKYQDQAESRRFTAYLAEHGCVYAETVVTGMSRGGCDRFENCIEATEIEEREYVCVATGKRITFSQFLDGSYGR